MEYTPEFLEQIVHMGVLGYPYAKIVNVIEVPEPEQFNIDFFDKESIINKSYQKGIDTADYYLDTKLFNMAKEGDKDAMYEFDRRKQMHQANFKKEITERSLNQYI